MANYILPIAMTSIDTNTFTGNLQAINANGLAHSCSIIRIVNDSDRDISISYDGTTEHDYLRSGDSLTLNLQTNSSPSSYASLIRKGTVVYVAGTAGGTGYIYLAGYYQAI